MVKGNASDEEKVDKGVVRSNGEKSTNSLRVSDRKIWLTCSGEQGRGCSKEREEDGKSRRVVQIFVHDGAERQSK